MNTSIHPSALPFGRVGKGLVVAQVFFDNQGNPLGLNKDLPMIYIDDVDKEHHKVHARVDVFGTEKSFTFRELGIPMSDKAGWRPNVCTMPYPDAQELVRAYKNRGKRTEPKMMPSRIADLVPA
jgi:hypothetical protein